MKLETKLFSKIKESHVRFATLRGVDKTYCPSEVARQLFPEDWRNKMDAVRKVADTLVQSGQLITTQKNQKINCLPSEANGPIRLKLA